MGNILDDSWVKSAFLLPADTIIGGNEAIVNRIYSTSMQKASDTTLGGNFVINPLPQFTRYADLKHNLLASANGRGNTVVVPRLSRSLATDPKGCNGMGRVYSEKFDDNMQVVHFRMGFPQFNSLTQFYTNYYSIPAAALARTGKAPGFFYKLGWAVGTVATIPMMPFLMVAGTAGKAINFFLKRPASKYYSLRPAMLPYWQAVSSMVNGIAANMGIIERPLFEGNKPLYDKDNGIDPADTKNMHRLIPSIYRENGGIDVFAVAQRGQRLVNERRRLLNNRLDKLTTKEEIREEFKKCLYGADMAEVFTNVNNMGSTLEKYVDTWRNSEMLGQIDDASAALTEGPVSKDERMEDKFVKRMTDAFISEARMGSEFMSLRVDFTGTQTESFSNSTKEPSIAGQINSISASARETRFSMFDGNIDGAGIVGGAIEAFKGFTSGMMDGLGIAGLAQLAGSAYVDIPKVWDSSSSDFNKLTLNIPLRSAYGDPISRLQNIILPMSCIFAMAVPLSTGKSSHTSPFLVEYFAQGRAHSRLAIVDSLTFTRGTGDIGWNNTGGFLGVDVQLGLLDLSSSVNMPINPSFEYSENAIKAVGYGVGGTIGWLNGHDFSNGGQVGENLISTMLGSTYDDDNSYTDYLSILAGIPLEAEINPARKWALRGARQQAKFDDAQSPERAVMHAMSGTFGDLAKAVSMVSDRG